LKGISIEFESIGFDWKANTYKGLEFGAINVLLTVVSIFNVISWMVV
jgi:hypothetical protein